jgi:hypothetical protein
MKRAGVPLLLGALAVGLVTYIVVAERNKPTPHAVQLRKGRLFPTWDSLQTTRVEIVHPKGTVTLVRDGDASLDYALVGSASMQSDPGVVDRMVSLFDFGIPIRTLDGPPKDFGAERVHGSFTVRGQTVTFVLGGAAPTPEGASYLKVDGTFHVVNRDFAADLEREPDAYREKTLLPYLSVALKHVTVEAADHSVRFERADRVNFKMLDGVRASRSHLDELWQPYAELRAESYVKDASAWSATNATLTMTLVPTQGETKTLALWDRACNTPESVPLRRSGGTETLDACVPRGALVALLRVTEARLRDRGLFSIRFDEFEEVALRAEQGQITWTRAPGGYLDRGANSVKVDGTRSETFERWLARVLALEGEWVAALPSGARNVGELTLSNSGGLSERVEFFVSGAETYVKRAADNAVFRYAQVLLAGYTNATSSLDNTGEVDEIGLDCGVAQVFRMTKDGPTGKVPFAIDHARVLELFDLVRRLKPDVWLLGKPGPSVCKIHIVRGGKRANFELGASPEGEWMSTEAGRSFLLPPEFAAACRRIYLERTFLESSERPIAIERNGKVLSGDALTRAASQLLLLKADEVEHLGSARATEGPFATSYRVHVPVDGGAPSTRVVSFGAVRGAQRFMRYDHVQATFLVDSSRLTGLE